MHVPSQHGSKDLVQQPLVGGACIFQPKRHHLVTVAARLRHERRFALIPWMHLLKMVAATSRHVFEEDFYVQFLYIYICFKNVLGSVLRLFKSRLFAE